MCSPRSGCRAGWRESPPAEVPGVEDRDPGDLEHEHGGAEDVARVVAPELDAAHLLLLVEIYSLDLIHGCFQITLIEHLVCGNVVHLKTKGRSYNFIQFQETIGTTNLEP